MICVDPEDIVSYAGKHITISVHAVDFQNQPVIGEVLMYSDCERGAFTNTTNYQKQILNTGQCTNFSFTLNFKGVCMVVFHIAAEDIEQVMYVTLVPCPIGFYNDDTSITCECHPYLIEQGITTSCDIDTTSITITHDTWLGHVVIDSTSSSLLPSTSANNGTFGYAAVCPTGYCREGLTHVDMTELHYLCQGHRIAVLCGACDEGYSMVLGSIQCLQCTSDTWFEVTIIFATAGLLLVLLLFCLRVTISSKLLGGIIFYANMTEVSMRTAVLHGSTYGQVIDIIFSLLNLNIGFHLCFYDGMTTIVKTVLQFVFPTYMCCIVVTLIIVSKFSTRVSNWTSHSSIQVLATLLYLSFAKLLLTVIDILIPVTIKTPEGDFTVWYSDGNVSYWNDTGHIALLIVAVVMGVGYLVPFVVWTTCGSLLLRFRYVRLRRSAVDAYHGQYRGGWGWWFGARVCLLVISYINYATLRGTNPTLLLVIHTSLVALFIFFQQLFRPFRLYWLNVMDSLVVANLLIVEFLSLYSELNGDISSCSLHISILLLTIIVVLVSIMGYHLWRNLVKWYRPNWQLNCRFRRFGSATGTRGDHEDEELREPLLDFID